MAEEPQILPALTSRRLFDHDRHTISAARAQFLQIVVTQSVLQNLVPFVLGVRWGDHAVILPQLEDEVVFVCDVPSLRCPIHDCKRAQGRINRDRRRRDGDAG